MNPDERLMKLARAISDDEEVQWNAAKAEARDADERELVQMLRDIGEVSKLRRTRTKDEERHPRAGGEATLASLDRWGPLELRGSLGRGATGTVYRAWDPRLQRDVALKLFRASNQTSKTENIQLLEEGRNLARLRHNNIVTVLGADEHDGQVGIWMELVEGKTLAEVVKERGQYSAAEASQVGIELCGALALVHRRRLIHGDIKAQNVKREDGGRYVLMDFSSSREAALSASDSDSRAIGTPLYMAPELWHDEETSASVESDIYALGVLLYYLATGEFPVRARTVSELRGAHETGKRVPLRDERPGLPEFFVEAIEKALSPDPRDRFHSAGELEVALRNPGTAPAIGREERGSSTEKEPLPFEVRVIARLARVAMWSGLIFLVLATLGFITSTALNVALNRPSEFAPESVVDWFLWGVRSLLGPAYHAVTTLFPLLVVILALRVARRFEPVRDRSSAWWSRIVELLAQSRADDPKTLSHVLAGTGAAVVAALVWRYSDLLEAIYRLGASRLDPATVAMLSPDNEIYHLAYRRDFTVVLIGLVVAAIGVRAYARWKKEQAHLLSLLGVMAVTAVLLEFPWQILWQADYPRVLVEGETCYEVGSREDDVMLFCPLSTESKTKMVEREYRDESLSVVIESVFSLVEPAS